MQRVLSGHDVTFLKDCNETRTRLEDEEYALVVLGGHFDESQLFSLLGDIRAHVCYRKERADSLDRLLPDPSRWRASAASSRSSDRTRRWLVTLNG